MSTTNIQSVALKIPIHTYGHYLKLQCFGVADVNSWNVLDLPPHPGGHIIPGALGAGRGRSGGSAEEERGAGRGRSGESAEEERGAGRGRSIGGSAEEEGRGRRNRGQAEEERGQAEGVWWRRNSWRETAGGRSLPEQM